jgi:hypothetical protein
MSDALYQVYNNILECLFLAEPVNLYEPGWIENPGVPSDFVDKSDAEIFAMMNAMALRGYVSYLNNLWLVGREYIADPQVPDRLVPAPVGWKFFRYWDRRPDITSATGWRARGNHTINPLWQAGGPQWYYKYTVPVDQLVYALIIEDPEDPRKKTGCLPSLIVLAILGLLGVSTPSTGRRPRKTFNGTL